MTLDWQNTIVAVAVVSALAYLGIKGYRIIAGRKGSGCGSCSNCPEADQEQAKPLVQIDINRNPKRQ